MFTFNLCKVGVVTKRNFPSEIAAQHTHTRCTEYLELYMYAVWYCGSDDAGWVAYNGAVGCGDVGDIYFRRYV